MSFLNPFFFIGSFLLTVPILIHLVRKDKSEIVRFSSLMFLRADPPSVTRKSTLNGAVSAAEAPNTAASTTR